ncbi:MAG: 3-hydroxyacyl-CoA dehydrogenase family protein [Myxococcales bacterium]|nr:3-hydroxyacyl-CoA dehydrogenase family protein [Myxococcales bacterium]
MGVSRVAVVGCGMMGRGIMEVSAVSGLEVKGVKLTPGSLDGPRQSVQKSLERRVKKGKLTQEQADDVLGRIEFTADLAAIAEADLVVESVVEDERTKVELLKKLEGHMHPEAVLGSNTSSLRLEVIAGQLTRPQNFLGLHFFSPVPAMALVEVGAIDQTADFAVRRASDFCEQIGKTVVMVKSSPGYVVNRLLVPYLLHGIETLESGIASAQDIDAAMKLGCAHPMGPLALSDLIGLDVVRAMAETLGRELGGSRYAMPETLTKLTDAGQLGRKSGIGIYDYSGESPVLNAALQGK